MSSALDEFKKPIEEWAGALVDGKPMENLLILYKLLYALRLPDRRNRFRDRPAVRSGYQKRQKRSHNAHKGHKRKDPNSPFSAVPRNHVI